MDLRDIPLCEFEARNCDAYRLLLRIELILRELLKEELRRRNGEKWQKLIPGNQLKVIREKQKEENRPQFGFVRLGPLYYLTYGELLEIYKQQAARSVIDRLGGDKVYSQLEGLVSMRNAVSHSRDVSEIGLKAITLAYDEMSTALTPSVIDSLLTHLDAGVTPEIAAKSLAEMCRTLVIPISAGMGITIEYSLISEIKDQYWWPDSSLAGFDCNQVENLLVDLATYASIPLSGIGSDLTRKRTSLALGLRDRLANIAEELEVVAK